MRIHELTELCYKLGYKDAQEQRDYDPHSHPETNIDIGELSDGQYTFNELYGLKGNWINVHESLPEQDKDVLICTSEASLCGKYIDISRYNKQHGYTYSCGVNWSGLYINEDVTHWCELPRLPI